MRKRPWLIALIIWAAMTAILYLSSEYSRAIKEAEAARIEAAELLLNYDPILAAAKGRKLDALSPYDDIIRRYADSLGWDWRLLTAVVYQESRFRHDALSHRGAVGLMQVMPSTGEDFGATDLLDHEDNIRTGTKILARIYPRYRRAAANSTERIWFTLAAYNAGIGRMTSILTYAKARGIDSGKWDDIAAIIPEMRDSTLISAVDSLNLTPFNGTETINYVQRVSDLYDAFKKLHPEE